MGVGDFPSVLSTAASGDTQFAIQLGLVWGGALPADGVNEGWVGVGEGLGTNGRF